ncbi:DUF1351 domain-containing protein [Neptunomonas sp. XY-337]|uniref:DUF1351 domain-containing protein n=1 Tax=Neptunomonas sp. XY-337 TaxID=2561897 RepID=UPI0010AB3713|nr:DUF1351 domain-containing protein [Neptunomonas sp. XY-337]
MSAAEKMEPRQATDLVVINTTPAAIAFNFEETKAWLKSELKQYDVVVTADTLAGSKKLATELNKMAGDIGKRRREAVEKVSGPIRTFEEQAKALEKMCKDGRQRLLDQVKVFEDETRALAKAKLEERRLSEWELHGVEDEFRHTQIEDLIKITALTKTGKLTAGSLNEVQKRVQADKQLQQQTEMRLLQLENQSYKAGLAAPLTRAHIETFLFASDEDYSQSLEAMLQSELQRQKVAEEVSRRKFEEEQRRKEQEAQREPELKQQTEAHSPTEPQTVHEPVTMETEPVQAVPVATVSKHAYGDLSKAHAANIVECSRDEAESFAVQLSNESWNMPIGVWVPGELVAIAYCGGVFRKTE